MTLSVQFYTLIVMIGMGLVLGACVDTYRFLIRMRFRTVWLKYGFDILFWIVYAFALFLLLYQLNEGTLRIHVFLAVLCGYAMYRALLESSYIHVMYFVYRILSSFIRFLRKILKNLIVYPIRWIIMIILSIAVTVLSSIQKVGCFCIRFFYQLLFTLFRPIFLFIGKMMPKPIQKWVQRVYNKIYLWISRIKWFFSQRKNGKNDKKN